MMVQVLVCMPGEVGEWGLVELQGQLETRDQVPLDSMHIGDLHFDNRGIPNLILGHHLLTGKVVELEKPFAILKKTIGDTADTAESVADCPMDLGSCVGVNSDADVAVKGPCTEYCVVALISKKIIFKNRPKPIITKTVVKKVLSSSFQSC